MGSRHHRPTPRDRLWLAATSYSLTNEPSQRRNRTFSSCGWSMNSSPQWSQTQLLLARSKVSSDLETSTNFASIRAILRNRQAFSARYSVRVTTCPLSGVWRARDRHSAPRPEQALRIAVALNGQLAYLSVQLLDSLFEFMDLLPDTQFLSPIFECAGVVQHRFAFFYQRINFLLFPFADSVNALVVATRHACGPPFADRSR